jgi:hypothetical protein
MKKFFITEEERKNILSQYKTILEQKKLDEQALQKDGTYKSNFNHQLKYLHGNKYIDIPKGTVFKKQGNNVMVGITGIYLPCDFKGYGFIYISTKDDNDMYRENQPDDKTWLSKTLRKLFCVKNKTVKKPQKKCNFVEMSFKEENFCKLSGDTRWVYIKTDENRWYTSKQTDKKTWCELTPQKFQKAIDILEKGCPQSQVVAQSDITPETGTA